MHKSKLFKLLLTSTVMFLSLATLAQGLTYQQLVIGQGQVLGASTPVLDTVGAGATQINTTSITASHTVTSGQQNCVVVAIVGWLASATTVSGVTYNGNSMTQMWNKRETLINQYGSAGFIIPVGTGDGVAHNVVATFAAAPNNLGLMTESFCGVDQTAIFRTAATTQFDTTSGSQSLVASNAQSGDLVIDGVTIGVPSNLTSGTTLNQSQLNLAGNGVSDATSQAAAAGATTMSYTFRASETIGQFGAAALIPVAAGTISTTPPVISNIASSGITQSAATITWTTDENSDSQVDYGTTTSYGSSSALNSSLTTTHTITLSSLSPSTLYHYRVKSSDASGNLAVSADNTFTTTATPPADTTAPTVPTGLTATAISSSGINLSWTAATDVDNTSAQISYTIYRGGVQIATTPAGTISYSDSSLTASTAYSYTVSASDLAGNTSIQSTNVSTETQAASGGGGAGTWTGILDPSRARDWTQVGAAAVLPGGVIPTNRPACTSAQAGVTIPIAAYTGTAATINTALTNCSAANPSGSYVQLGAGTFTLSSAIHLGTNNVTLKGMGPDQTVINDSGTIACGVISHAICIGGQVNYNANVANWTSGYARGSTNLTIGPNITGNASPQVGSLIFLNQRVDGDSMASDTYPAIFDCVLSTCAGGPTGAGGDWAVSDGGTAGGRPQIQIVKVTSIQAVGGGTCTPTVSCTITFFPAILMPNWRASQAPQIRWGGGAAQTGDGLEGFQMVNSGWGIGYGVGNWVRNVEVNWSGVGVTGARMTEFAYSLDNTLEDSYIFGPQGSATQAGDPYAWDCWVCGDSLVQNNIFQHTRSQIIHEQGYGSVMAYNYIFNNFDTSGNRQTGINNHGSDAQFWLAEGNDSEGIAGNNYFGGGNFWTLFRNNIEGSDPSGPTQNNTACSNFAMQRFTNYVGNICGTAGYTLHYQKMPNDGNSASSYYSEFSAFSIGYGLISAPDDPHAADTTMRWGNYAICSDPNTHCNTVSWDSSEVPSTLAYYANPVPANHILPASFYLSVKPAWWGNMPFPAIGPDIAGGDLASKGGHVYRIPARVCFEDVMHGSFADSAPQVFNAATCYSLAYAASGGSSDTTPPTTPSAVTATAISSSAINLSWSASTDSDNTASQLTYKVFRNGTQVGTTAAGVASYSDTGLTAGTTYNYTISASDPAGNSSAQSSPAVPATTQSSPDTTAPTVSITSPANNASVTGTITVSASASDPTVNGQVASGLALVTISVDGTVFATSTSGTVSKSLDTTTLTNSSHTITAIAKDNAGNTSTTATVTITVNNASATKYPRLITLTSLEGLSSIPAGTTITATVLSPSSGSTLETQSNLTPTAGNYTVSFLPSDPQLVNIRITVAGYLSQLLTNIDTTVNSSVALSVPQLLAGDLNSDNTINSLDYSFMNSHFLQNYAAADINRDGLVNSLDYAILKNNYGKSGQ